MAEFHCLLLRERIFVEKHPKKNTL